MFEKRVNIFTGHFGSGKTEVAVNYALKLAEEGYRTAIADFDIVNPYFRTADAQKYLEEKGIWVVLPLYANKNVDVPALTGEINALFQKKEFKVVLDVGGDDLGAKAVSRYRDEIIEDDYEMFFVINTRRPMTGNVGEIMEAIASIEGSARIKVTKLVNNTNLLSETTPDIIMEGLEIIHQVSSELNIPVAFSSGLDEVISRMAGSSAEYLRLDKQIRLPWN